MALLWRHRQGGATYEVRNAGHSLRLYTNGVLHSQHNPRRGFAGGVWDLLALPALFRRPGSMRRVLLLGVGGGGAVAALRRFAVPEQIIGVDIDRIHLAVAQKFFRIGGPDLELVHDDAVTWLTRYRGPPFDMIVEDLCGAGCGGPVRSVSADAEWFGRLHGHLRSPGLLVMNFLGLDGLRNSAYGSDAGVTGRYVCCYQFTTPHYDNRVAAFLDFASTPRQLRRNLRGLPGVRPAIRFRVSALDRFAGSGARQTDSCA